MNAFEEYHQYSQNLLLAQYDVSEIIKHLPSRGEVREDFIIQYLSNSIQNSQDFLKRGFIDLGEKKQSGQSDILLIKEHAEIITLGKRDIIIVNPDDCLLMIEVKSTLKGSHLKDFNTHSQKIKEVNPDIVCGIFAYKSDLEKKTIMKRCGYDYKTETMIYFDSSHQPLPLSYPFIDFILLLDKVESFDVDEDIELQGQNELYLLKGLNIEDRYFQGTFTPVIRNLVGLVRSLLKR